MKNPAKTFRNLSLSAIGLSVGLASFSLADASAAEQPNIILIFVDDQGYTDLGILGIDPDVRTPHLDQLARDGILFRHGYVTAPQCTPSRAGLITGRHQNNFNMEANRTGPLPHSEYTIAERLKDVGYTTGLVGKWHLATNREFGDPQRRFNSWDHLPNSFGFDEYWNGEMSWYFASHDLQGNPLEGAPVVIDDNRFRVDVQTEAALGFLERRANDEQPFFLYLAWFAPHAPMQGPPEYMARLPHVTDRDRRMGLASILAMDDGVGLIREKLEEMGVADNTLIFYISDNGAPLKRGSHIGSSNIPMVGEKGMLSDGGIRVPFIMTWPGVLPGGQVVDDLVWSLDATATSLAAAGAPLDDKIEGLNLLPFYSAEPEPFPSRRLHWRWGSQAAVREDNWKLLMLGDQVRYLVDMTQDGQELAQFNQLEAFPEIAHRLQRQLVEQSEQWQPSGLPNAIGIAAALHFREHIDPDLDIAGLLGMSPDDRRIAGPPASRRAAPLEAEETEEDAGDVVLSDWQGWVVRNGQLTHEGRFIRMAPMGADSGRPFFLTNGGQDSLDLKPPVQVELEMRAHRAGELSIAFRTVDTPRDFQTAAGTRVELPVGVRWQTVTLELSASANIAQIRLLTEAHPNQRLDFRAIRLTDADGREVVLEAAQNFGE